MRTDRASVWGVGLVIAALAIASPASAAFPGANGRLAYDDVLHVFSVNADGTGTTQLTNGSDWEFGPGWSPDGQRILFTSSDGSDGLQVYVMNADGSGQTRLTTPPDGGWGPAWAPDGRKIVFTRSDGDLWTMNQGGSELTRVAALPGTDSQPDWSPDGSRIAFVRGGDLYTIRPDGTGLTQIATGQGFFPTISGPDWSPDASRLVFRESYDYDAELCYDINVVRRDGTGRTTIRSGANRGECEAGPNHYAQPAWSPDGQRIASNDGWRHFTMRADGSDFQSFGPEAFAESMDWQQVPALSGGTHVRPKGATPFRVPLVPAYNACTSPNRTHGPPLAFPSCNPPQPASGRLTVGVGDGSPAFSRSEGFLRMDVIVGQPGPPDDSDVSMRFRLSNVMRASDLSEYTGELRVELTVRRTDRDPPDFGGPHSTSMDFPFGFTAPCTPTPSSSVDASNCISFTSTNAIVPFAVEDAHRAIWELEKVRVYDGGPDEDGDTVDDNSLFATQGVFVP